MVRKPIGTRAMTEAERQRRWHERNGKMSALARARSEVTRLREQVAELRAQLRAERRRSVQNGAFSMGWLSCSLPPRATQMRWRSRSLMILCNCLILEAPLRIIDPDRVRPQCSFNDLLGNQFSYGILSIMQLDAAKAS